MIDLHIHLLPGVDDGPSTEVEAVHMCQLAAEGGCEALVATPHQRREWPTRDGAALRLKIDSLRDSLGGRGPDLYLGAEIRVGTELLDELESKDLGGLLPLAGSRYLLIEFDDAPSPGTAQELIHELVVAGWTPVVAHPEMIPGLARNLPLLDRLVALGATLQLTAMSVTGGFGPEPRRSSFAILDEGLAHFVASDAHSPQWRPPGLAAAHTEIRSRWGEAAAARLTHDHPKAVLEGRALPQ